MTEKEKELRKKFKEFFYQLLKENPEISMRKMVNAMDVANCDLWREERKKTTHISNFNNLK